LLAWRMLNCRRVLEAQRIRFGLFSLH
jgi:hypothetical protein